MKKQLLELTIEEFTRVLLEYPEEIHLTVKTYDLEGKKSGEDEITGTYEEISNYIDGFPLNHPFREAIEKELSLAFDYSTLINDLDIYNYLNHITNQFQQELIRIIHNEMECFYMMIYSENIDAEVVGKYEDLDLEIPTKKVILPKLHNKGEMETRIMDDLKAMREYIYPCREFAYNKATSLLERKMSSQQTKEQGKYTISKGHKTDFVKLVSAMYDCHLFETTDGKTASNKEDLLNSLGKFFSENLTASSTLLNEAKKKNNYLDIFDKIKEKGEKYYKKGL